MVIFKLIEPLQYGFLKFVNINSLKSVNSFECIQQIRFVHDGVNLLQSLLKLWAHLFWWLTNRSSSSNSTLVRLNVSTLTALEFFKSIFNTDLQIVVPAHRFISSLFKRIWLFYFIYFEFRLYHFLWVQNTFLEVNPFTFIHLFAKP